MSWACGVTWIARRLAEPLVAGSNPVMPDTLLVLLTGSNPCNASEALLAPQGQKVIPDEQSGTVPNGCEMLIRIRLPLRFPALSIMFALSLGAYSSKVGVD